MTNKTTAELEAALNKCDGLIRKAIEALYTLPHGGEEAFNYAMECLQQARQHMEADNAD